MLSFRAFKAFGRLKQQIATALSSNTSVITKLSVWSEEEVEKNLLLVLAGDSTGFRSEKYEEKRILGGTALLETVDAAALDEEDDKYATPGTSCGNIPSCNIGPGAALRPAAASGCVCSAADTSGLLWFPVENGLLLPLLVTSGLGPFAVANAATVLAPRIWFELELEQQKAEREDTGTAAIL